MSGKFVCIVYKWVRSDTCFAFSFGFSVDMNIQKGTGGTALYIAAQNGHRDVVELLADKGAGTCVCV